MDRAFQEVEHNLGGIARKFCISLLKSYLVGVKERKLNLQFCLVLYPCRFYGGGRSESGFLLEKTYGKYEM